MLGSPIALQGFDDALFGGFDASMPMLCQRQGVTLTMQNGSDDRLAGLAAQIINDVVQFHIHLIQSPVHMLQVLATLREQILPITMNGTHRADSLLGSIRSP